tara:strand:- start:495 stop:1145 length:651 start_codon:yes stop_codon:yes gene_type:complete
MKKVLLIILASYLSLGTAQAVEFSIGAGLNTAVFAATGAEKNCNESGAECATTEEHGAFSEGYPSVFVEAQINDQISLGLSYQGGFETPSNTNDGKGTATSIVQVDFEDFYSVYAKLNVPLGGLYLKAGISTVEAITNETQRSGNTYPNASLDGVVVGIGYEHATDAGVNLRAEIQGHGFSDVSVDNGQTTSGNLNQITISEMIGATGSLQLVKTF